MEERRREEDVDNQRRLQLMNLDVNETRKMEKWTNKKCGEVVFDSNIDNWSRNTSVFDTKVMNRSHLIFVIEDTKNNKFGYYFTGTVNKLNDWIKSPNCFIFSLKANNRSDGMYKFEEKNSCAGIIIGDKSHEWTIHVAWGFIVFKENGNEKTYLVEAPDYFDYHNRSNAYFCNSSGSIQKYFRTRRLTVIQMQ